MGEALKQGRGLYRKGVGEKRVVRSDGCADLDGYGGAGGGGCLLRKRIGLLFCLPFLIRYRKLILGCHFRLLLIFSRSLLRAVGMIAGFFLVVDLASWRWGLVFRRLLDDRMRVGGFGLGRRVGVLGFD